MVIAFQSVFKVYNVVRLSICHQGAGPEAACQLRA